MNNIFKIKIDNNRVFGLDILRAIAISTVVIGHGGRLLPDKLRTVSDLFVIDGVSIFFVLSGFLIGGILIRKITENGINKETLLDFWIRRWFRTLPNYFLILFTICLLNLFLTENFDFSGSYSYLFFFQNFYKPHPPLFPEAWSLSIEEWFYIIIPISITTLSLILKGNHKNIILSSAIIILISITTFRYYRYIAIPIKDFSGLDLIFRKQVITRLDSLMYGILGAYICYYHHQLWIKYKGKLLMIGIALFIFSKFLLPNFIQINGIYSTVFSFSVESIATLLLLPFLSELKTGKGIIFKLITYISLISYSMYLLNLSIIQHWIINNIPWNNLFDNPDLIFLLKYGLYWILLFMLSTLLFKYFELPMTRLRDNEKIKKLIQSRVSFFKP